MTYSLVGVDGNAFMVMGYVRSALKKSGHVDLLPMYSAEATAGGYDELICCSLRYLDVANGDMEPEDAINVALVPATGEIDVVAT